MTDDNRMNVDFDIVDYRWPAEWEPHAATWTAWPVNRNTWPGIFVRIPAAFAEFVAAIARFEPVNILASSDVQRTAWPLIDAACESAAAGHEVRFFDITVNDSWCRDYGPIFLNRRPEVDDGPQQIILNWNYNAWGGKYPPWDLDNVVAGLIADQLQLPKVEPGLVLEGGAVEGNGCGTVLTTESCLLNPNRNGTVSADFWEDQLQRYLQALDVVWLPGKGVLGDDTDGHIDQIARFVDAATVVVAEAWNDDAPEADALRSNAQAVTAARTKAGDRFQIQNLRMPSPKFQQGHQLPASYCNFCICNDGIILPVFDDPADDLAADILQAIFPTRKVVCVSAVDLVWGLGSFHCLTQQQPREI